LLPFSRRGQDIQEKVTTNDFAKREAAGCRHEAEDLAGARDGGVNIDLALADDEVT
jgi:hypothetical protein